MPLGGDVVPLRVVDAHGVLRAAWQRASFGTKRPGVQILPTLAD
jgi:hypothetical protein